MKEVYKYDTSRKGFKKAAYVSILVSLLILAAGLYFLSTFLHY
jgi:hypothetical protein